MNLRLANGCNKQGALIILISFEPPSLYSFHASQAAFRAALCDSFNTPEAINILRELVSKTNVYIKAPGGNLEIGLVQRVARWVGDILRMFGLGEGETQEIGWGQERSADEGSVNVRPSLHSSASLPPPLAPVWH